MKDDRTMSKKRLMEELGTARRKIASLQESLIEHERTLKALQQIEEIYRFQ
jgi:hypothetical protein